ncbi:RNA 2',3'-cyclic phosphodiesterase [Bacillus canaveralius]|uniref:RNA 2',3'-cyclic phosphodiesterase n=1 Tax=Bacillus canaveralius TaxID=1403243 RepID=A0A2N5GHD9_9BACI|nr:MULTISPECIES: RNA 2',3'-cyclic phosphodiesterase [Bacillus]PLR80172.1 RNA 2',3'-cyclic phosphodiesterase [Bacillus canaveralius]PLR83841.1 RNA 2',3'-cyclic phosphodiesterase [Bacillus sp. V33-4]PLR98685.1 RNA 2',3'-cyclic phosphodiesterase [Bacillus canaveralius]RSK48187.1 RNA 2',3'-cyclic phosphodiesterase [Bacillus canaveralius]
MGNQPHYFIAVSLPKETKQQLNETAKQLGEDFPFAKWVHEEDFHVTLAFLGASSDEKIAKTIELTNQALTNVGAFRLTIDHIGVFGKKDSPRVFWAGLIREDRLHEVRDLVFSACERAGYSLETRPFAPHITLARNWSGPERLDPHQLKEKNILETEPLSFLATEVVLYRIHPGNTPKYRAFATFPLHIE